MTDSSSSSLEQLMQLQQTFWQTGFANLQQVLRGQSNFAQSLHLLKPIPEGGEHALTVERIKEQAALFTQWSGAFLSWLEENKRNPDFDIMVSFKETADALTGKSGTESELGLGIDFWRQQQDILLQVAPTPLFTSGMQPFATGSQTNQDHAGWQQYQVLTARWMEMVSQMQVTALNDFQQQLKELDEGDEQTVNQLHDIWVRCCESSYQDSASDDEFSKLYGDLINSVNHMVADARQAINKWLSTSGLPTQQEYDELAEMHQELRREHRLAQDELEQLRAGTPPKKARKKRVKKSESGDSK